MTPLRFLECVAALGWTRSYLARLLHCDTNLPARWAGGQAIVPQRIAAWLEHRVRAAERLPVPDDWRRR
jgi:hypothetical protein